LGAVKVVAGTAPENLPSRRLLAKLGLRETGEGMYALPREEWEARRKAEDGVGA
jgi:RimJ/RimL family protein N-acetyltransferase